MESSAPVIAAKLRPPQVRQSLVERPHLVESLLLHKSKRVILVSAPSGYGKTCLLSLFYKELAARQCRIGWICLDEKNNTPLGFIRYLSEALKQAGLSKILQAEENFSDLLLTSLLNEIDKHEDEIYLFLDGLECIHDAQILEFIRQLIALASSKFHFVIGSRSKLPLSKNKLQIQNDLFEIQQENLAFSFEETLIFLKKNASRGIAAEEAQITYKLLEGWPAGLQLFLSAYQKKKFESEVSSESSALDLSITNYLEEDVLNGSNDDTLKTMSKLSILNYFNEGITLAISGTENAKSFLQGLSDNNLFIIPIENKPGWFRFHPFFARTLRQNHLPKYDIEIKDLHAKAAHWYSKNDNLHEAIDHALKAEDWALTLDYIEAIALNLGRDDRSNEFSIDRRPAALSLRLMSWIEKIPSESFNKRPMLQVAVATMLTYSGQLEKAASIILHLEKNLTSLDPAIRDYFPPLKAGLALYRDDSGEILKEMSEWTQERLPETPYLAAFAGNFLTYGLAHAGRFIEARDAQIRMSKWSAAERGHQPFILGECFFGLTHALEGNMKEAKNYYASALSKAEELLGRRSSIACLVAGYYSEVLYELNELDGVRAILAGRWDIIDSTSPPDSLLRAYTSMGCAEAALGDNKAALSWFEKLYSSGVTKGLDRLTSTALYHRIKVYLSLGDLNNASLLYGSLKELTGSGQKSEGFRKSVVAIEVLAKARIDMAKSSHVAASESIEEHRELTAHMHDKRKDAKLTILSALSHVKSGNRTVAIELIQQALRQANELGLRRTFLEEGRECRLLLQEVSPEIAIEDQALKSYLSDLDRDFGDLSEKRSSQSRRVRFDEGMLIENILTDKEKEVLRLLMQGLPNKTIAQASNISVTTTKWHLKNIYEKLDVKDRHEAIIAGREQGFE